jgi:hypothetical protein
VEDPVKARSTPAQEIAVRVSAPEHRPVDVHITERGGEMRVAVRTADAGLKVALRDDLNSLVGRLDRSGFRAEAAVPGEAAPQVFESRDPESSSAPRVHAVTETAAAGMRQQYKSNAGEQSQPDSGSRQQPGQESQQGRPQQDQPQRQQQHPARRHAATLWDEVSELMEDAA